MIPLDSPFHPDNEAGYQAWRAQKLAGYPQRGEDLVVPIKDPKNLSAEEYAAIWRLVQKANMAIYATDLGEREDKESIKQLAAQFGLERLDANWLADEDGISSLTPQDEDGQKRGENEVSAEANAGAAGVKPRSGDRSQFIPYTHHRIRWHTDGYYNPPERRIFAMTLHCVRAADEGGENELMDHELAYLHLRDANPDHIRALMAEDAMTIPARLALSPTLSQGEREQTLGPNRLDDEQGVARPDEAGPALLVDAGQLHLRYTARTKSIAWKQDAATLAAVKALEDLLASGPAGVFKLKLQPGMGLLCNNVLHTRSGFSDRPEHRRLLYRARYHDHIRNLRS